MTRLAKAAIQAPFAGAFLLTALGVGTALLVADTVRELARIPISALEECYDALVPSD